MRGTKFKSLRRASLQHQGTIWPENLSRRPSTEWKSWSRSPNSSAEVRLLLDAWPPSHKEHSSLWRLDPRRLMAVFQKRCSICKLRGSYRAREVAQARRKARCLPKCRRTPTPHRQAPRRRTARCILLCLESCSARWEQHRRAGPAHHRVRVKAGSTLR